VYGAYIKNLMSINIKEKKKKKRREKYDSDILKKETW